MRYTPPKEGPYIITVGEFQNNVYGLRVTFQLWRARSGPGHSLYKVGEVSTLFFMDSRYKLRPNELKKAIDILRHFSSRDLKTILNLKVGDAVPLLNSARWHQMEGNLKYKQIRRKEKPWEMCYNDQQAFNQVYDQYEKSRWILYRMDDRKKDRQWRELKERIRKEAGQVALNRVAKDKVIKLPYFQNLVKYNGDSKNG